MVKTEIYTKFAIAAGAVQLLETELVTSLIALEALEHWWAAAPKARAAKIAHMLSNSLTKGRPMGRLKKQLEIEAESIFFICQSNR